MSGPPPPPPPPGPPPPSIGGGGGGGQPAFLADIRKGAQLKKVPDSLKNDRSAALVSGGGGGGGGSGGGGGGGGGGSGGGGGRLMGPPMGGAGGAVPSNADIRAKLNAMFGGAPMPAAAPRPDLQSPVKRPSLSSQLQPSKSVPAQPPPPPPPRPPSQAELNPSPVIPVLTAQQQPQPQPPRPRREAPRAPNSNCVNGAPRSFRPKPQAPPPPPHIPSNGIGVGGGTYKPTYQMTKNDRVAPSLPVRETDSWESRFQFPDESMFPPVPETYRGPKTFVYYRASGDDL